MLQRAQLMDIISQTVERLIFLLQQPDFFPSRHPIIYRRRTLRRFRRFLPRPLVRIYMAPPAVRSTSATNVLSIVRAISVSRCSPSVGQEWSATSIIIHCDNEATVHCINKGRSHSPTLMPLLRRLIWISACEQFIITAKHIPGSKNLIADSLSRFAFQKFRALAPEADPLPTLVPPYSELIFP